jgi:hypothetical protein
LEIAKSVSSTKPNPEKNNSWSDNDDRNFIPSPIERSILKIGVLTNAQI